MRATNGRANILKAARNTFADKGFDGASIRDIAQEAGLSLSALYYYFPSKQDALFELINSAFSWYIEHADGVVDSAGPASDEQVGLLVRFITRYRLKNPLISRVVVRDTERLEPDKRDRIHQLQRRSRAILTDAIDGGVSQGVFDVDNPQLAGRAILSITNSLPLWYVPGGGLDEQTIERTFVKLALRLLGYPDADARLDHMMALSLHETGEVNYLQ